MILSGMNATTDTKSYLPTLFIQSEGETLSDIKVAPVTNGGTINPGFETDLGEKKRSKNSYSPNKETARL